MKPMSPPPRKLAWGNFAIIAQFITSVVGAVPVWLAYLQAKTEIENHFRFYSCLPDSILIPYLFGQNSLIDVSIPLLSSVVSLIVSVALTSLIIAPVRYLYRTRFMNDREQMPMAIVFSNMRWIALTVGILLIPIVLAEINVLNNVICFKSNGIYKIDMGKKIQYYIPWSAIETVEVRCTLESRRSSSDWTESIYFRGPRAISILAGSVDIADPNDGLDMRQSFRRLGEVIKGKSTHIDVLKPSKTCNERSVRSLFGWD